MRQAPETFHDDPDDDDARPSKSERKRQMHDLQALGEALLELPASRVAPLELPEILRDAMAEYHRTRSFEGKRRQLQYIGKLMRKTDPDPIREAIAAYKLGSASETLALHEAERWREELMASDEAVTRWINANPGTEPQRLRNLVRAARKDAQAAAEGPAGAGPRHGRNYRELFQLVKAALAESAAPAAGGTDDDEEADDE